MIVPVHRRMSMSSPPSESMPYETVPSPTPFSPFSSSSRSRKLRGTAAGGQVSGRVGRRRRRPARRRGSGGARRGGAVSPTTLAPLPGAPNMAPGCAGRGRSLNLAKVGVRSAGAVLTARRSSARYERLVEIATRGARAPAADVRAPKSARRLWSRVAPPRTPPHSTTPPPRTSGRCCAAVERARAERALENPTCPSQIRLAPRARTRPPWSSASAASARRRSRSTTPTASRASRRRPRAPTRRGKRRRRSRRPSLLPPSAATQLLHALRPRPRGRRLLRGRPVPEGRRR